MESLILVAVLVLVVVFIMGMTHNNPLNQQAQNGLQHVNTQAQAWYQDYMNWYEASIQPSVRRLGFVFMGLLATSVAMAWLLPGGSLPFKWIVAVGASAIIAGYLVYREMRRPPADFTVLTFGPTLIAAAAFHGVVVFVAGHAADSQYVTFMGALELFFALRIFRMVGGAAVKLAAFGFYGTEGIVNMVTRVVTAVATLGAKGLADVFGSGGVVIVKEEDWHPAYERGMKRLFATIAPVLSFGVVLHDPKVTTFVGLVGFVVGLLVYPTLDAASIDITGRKQRTARIYEVLMYLFLVFAGLKLFAPGADTSLVNLKNDLATAIVGVFTSTHRGFDWISGSGKGSYIPALFAAIIFGAGAAFAWGESRIRKFGGGVLAFFAVVAAGAFLVTASIATAQTVRDETVGSGKLIEEEGFKAELTPAGTVMLSWTASMGAQEFVIERRESTGRKFVPVTITDSTPAVVEPLELGVTSWEDASAVKGKTYFYHLVTTTQAGKKVVSEEAKVVMPKASEAPPKESPAADAPVPKPSSGKTEKTAAANPALDEYCARNPGVCSDD